MRSRILLVFLSATFTCSCTPPPETDFTEADRATIAAAVQDRVDGYCPAVLSKDVGYLNGFWADTPGFIFAGDGEIQMGYAYIRDSNQTFFEGSSEPSYCSMSNSHVYVLGPDAASLATEYEWGMVTAEGETIEAYGSWMYVFARLDREWKVVHSAGTHLYK